MSRVTALVRVRDGGALELVSILPGGDLAAMAEATALSALRRAEPTSGVYRVVVGDEATVERVAGPDETVAVATVARRGAEAVDVTALRVSSAPGVVDDERVEGIISEAAARAALEIPVGEERLVEVVIP